MIAPYYGLALRKRPPVSARTPAPDVGERFGRMRENGERLVGEPFTGITTDGSVVPGLLPAPDDRGLDRPDPPRGARLPGRARPGAAAAGLV